MMDKDKTDMTLVHNNYHCYHHRQQQKEPYKAVLAVGDEPAIIDIMEHSSQNIGFKIAGFTDPLLALETLRGDNNEYFLVMSDLYMPSMNGFEFIRKSKLISPGIRTMLMTASDVCDSNLFRDLVSSLKIDFLIQKPISMRTLKHIIQKQYSLHTNSCVVNYNI